MARLSRAPKTGIPDPGAATDGEVLTVRNGTFELGLPASQRTILSEDAFDALATVDSTMSYWLTDDNGEVTALYAGNFLVQGGPSRIPTVKAAPRITYLGVGFPLASTVLTAVKGIYKGGQISRVIQWQTSTDGGVTWADISGATSSSYTIPGGDTAGTAYRFKETPSNAAGAGATQTSAATGTKRADGSDLFTEASDTNLSAHTAVVPAATWNHVCGNNHVVGGGTGNVRSPTTAVTNGSVDKAPWTSWSPTMRAEWTWDPVTALIGVDAMLCVDNNSNGLLIRWDRASNLMLVQVRAGWTVSGGSASGGTQTTITNGSFGAPSTPVQGSTKAMAAEIIWDSATHAKINVYAAAVGSTPTLYKTFDVDPQALGIPAVGAGGVYTGNSAGSNTTRVQIKDIAFKMVPPTSPPAANAPAYFAGSGSVWNRFYDAGQDVAIPEAAAMTASLVDVVRQRNRGAGALAPNITSGTYGVVLRENVDSSDTVNNPKMKVWLVPQSNGVNYFPSEVLSRITDVPMPTNLHRGARPTWQEISTGLTAGGMFDGHTAIHDVTRDRVYGFWKLQRDFADGKTPIEITVTNTSDTTQTLPANTAVTLDSDGVGPAGTTGSGGLGNGKNGYKTLNQLILAPGATGKATILPDDPGWCQSPQDASNPAIVSNPSWAVVGVGKVPPRSYIWDAAGVSFPGQGTPVALSAERYDNASTSLGYQSGTFANEGVRAIKWAVAGGVIRKADLDAGQIDHALAMAGPRTNYVLRRPAVTRDGAGYTGEMAPVQGQRFIIPASAGIVENDPKYANCPLARWIIRAWRLYGVVHSDTAGGQSLVSEDSRDLITQRGFSTYTLSNYTGGLTGVQVAQLLPWELLVPVARSGEITVTPSGVAQSPT